MSKVTTWNGSPKILAMMNADKYKAKAVHNGEVGSDQTQKEVAKHQRVRRVKPELYQDMTFEKERG